jgi:AcrR family transcriptional regulator
MDGARPWGSSIPLLCLWAVHVQCNTRPVRPEGRAYPRLYRILPRVCRLGIVKATRRRLDRAAVVEAAELLVDRDGAAQLAMTALANELEIRGPSLYSHVANLEELLSLVQNRALAELGSGLQRAAMGRSGRDGVRALAAALRTFATGHPGRYDLAMSKPIDRPAMQVASRAAGEAFVAVIESMGVPLSNELAFSCLATLHGVLTLDRAGLYPRSEVDVDAVYAQATELVLHVMEQAAPIDIRVD